MIIAVGSTNQAKVSAVEEVLLESSGFSKAQLQSIVTDSGVSDQPLSLSETLRGAQNRAKSAFNQFENCQYSFGIESGLIEASEVQTKFMHVSVCSIFDGQRHYTGLSTGF